MGHSRARAARRRAAARSAVAEAKAAGCVSCGESRPEALTFHHVDPLSKRACVSDLAGRGYTVATVRREIAKCDVLCRDCHRAVHARPLVGAGAQ